MDDWENDDFVPVLPAAKAAEKPAASSLAADVDTSKFADEDAELEEEKKHAVPASQVGSRPHAQQPQSASFLTPSASSSALPLCLAQPKKKEEKKYLKETGPVDVPLDDPVAEKLRRQRCPHRACSASGTHPAYQRPQQY